MSNEQWEHCVAIQVSCVIYNGGMHFKMREMEVKVNDASNEKFKFEHRDLPKTSAILLKMESKDAIFQLCVTSA